MSDYGWDHGQDHQRVIRGHSATGIAEVIEGYSTRGGQLLGARRWVENPLTLTHVRWMGPQGIVVDAVRRPDADLELDDERAVWVELALGFPATHPGPAEQAAPWAVLNISPQQAAGLAVRLARALASAPPGSGIRYTSPPEPAHYDPHAMNHPVAGGWASQPPSGSISPMPHSAPTPSWPPQSWASGGPASGGAAQRHSPAGNYARGPVFDDGVSVIPCVDIELPVTVTGAVAPSSTRDFARDAASTFVRAVRGLPQAREIRGWMRDGRMVLAARFIVAPGAGAATPEEREDAIRLLARTLAQHTLPFARVGLADPGEWNQGQALSE